jgi:Phytanoyl-CoA dioxygenase (PhyH)
MDSIDRRTRFDRDIVEVTAEVFFAETFPDLLARHGQLAGAGFEQLRARPLTIEVGPFCRTLTAEGHTLDVVEGVVDGSTTVTLDAEQFSDWAQQVRTLSAMISVGELRWRGGGLRQLAVWDSLWIALLEGWPVVDADLRFRDRNDDPLDLARCFTPEDDPQDIAQFLRATGYVHLRGWLSHAEMDAVSEDMDRAHPSYRDGDGRSWWATLGDGSRRCVRMQHFVEHSATTAAILRSERWDHLRQTIAGPDDLVQGPVEGNCIEALFKPLAVDRGVSDIPWHRDCSLGRHAYGCSSTTVGLSVSPGGAASGQLRVVAGSHRVAMPPELAYSESYLPIVALPTQTADVTVHLGCTIHEAMPPLAAERRVMYTGFGLRPRPGDEQQRGRDRSELRERAARSASQSPSPLITRS